MSESQKHVVYVCLGLADAARITMILGANELAARHTKAPDMHTLLPKIAVAWALGAGLTTNRVNASMDPCKPSLLCLVSTQHCRIKSDTAHLPTMHGLDKWCVPHCGTCRPSTVWHLPFASVLTTKSPSTAQKSFGKGVQPSYGSEFIWDIGEWAPGAAAPFYLVIARSKADRRLLVAVPVPVADSF